MGESAVRRRTNGHVERTSLLLRVDEEFERSGIVILSAPAGFGKTSLLEDVARRRRSLRGRGASVVSVDCSQRRCRAFLENCRERRARGERRPPTAGGGLGGASVPDEPLCQLLWACLDERAPEWADALRARASVMPGAPLLLVDNVPPFETEDGLSQLGEMLRRWAACGLRAALACVPSCDVSNEFPDSLRLTCPDMRVSRGEMALWARELRLSEADEVLDCTAGIPALIGACRNANAHAPIAEDLELRRRAASVVRRALAEPATAAVERLETSMLLLGEGRVGELGDIGMELRPDDLAIVSDVYPLFGLDLVRGTFRTVPLDMTASQDLFMEVVQRDPALAGACAGVLVGRGDVSRAVALLRIMPDDALAEALGTNAMSLLDAAVDDLACRGLRYVGDGGACSPRAQRGLARLDVLRHEVRGTPLASAASAELAGTSGGWCDVREVAEALAGSWETLGPSVRAPEGRLEGDAGGQAEGDGGSETDGNEGAPGSARPSLAELCARLARAAADCNPGLASVARDALLPRLAGVSLLSARLLCHHAALCTILAFDPAGALGWIASTSSVTRDSYALDEAGRDPQTVSEALLAADASVARILVERPSAAEGSVERFKRLRSCRMFLEQRNLAASAPWAGVLEALCCAFDGRESEGLAGAEEAMSAFRASGCLYGQLLCIVARAFSELARRQAGQAAVSAAAARRIATSVHSRPLGELARLLETLAQWPRQSVAGLDARLLEVTLCESALAPRVSRALVMERALLCCASGDSDGAREALDEAASFDGALNVRLLCSVVRASGNLRSRMADLCSPAVRLELAGMGRHASAGPPPVTSSVSASLPLHSERLLNVRMFGGMSVEIRGQELDMGQWGRTKSRQLLGVLAMSADRPMQREHIMAALWPGRDPDTLKSSLYSVLTNLRGMLGQKNGGPQLVESIGNVVRLNLELVEVDVLRFETMARDVLSRRGTLPDAELFSACSEMDRAYREGLDPEFDNLGDEGLRRSEVLAALFAEVMVYGSRRAMASGDPSLALWMARSAQRACGHREDVALAVMRSLRALSRFSAALCEYRSFADFERDTFGMQPPAVLRRERDSIVSELAVSGSLVVPPEVLADGAACMAAMERVDADVAAGYALYRQRR